MNQNLDISNSTYTSSFFRFVVWQKTNSNLLLIAVTVTAVQFFIFKSLYPFPDFFSDSYSYLFGAYAELDLNVWPIGYSKFLLAFHNFTYSALALIAFQYFFIIASAIYFYFSFLFFYQPKKLTRTLLFIFLFLNPLFLYISNYVNSDPLFAALSLIWFTQLLWIIHSPKKYQIYFHAIILFVCFAVRNNAYYYPLITVIAFGLSRANLKFKLAGIALPFLFIIPFIIHSRNVALEMTGTKQFSLLSGWVLANNALYMYQHITVNNKDLPTKETRDLDLLAKDYYRHMKPEFDDYLTSYVANYFIRQPDAPLKKYFTSHYNPKDEYESISAWGQASAIYNDYGNYLIMHNPISFIRHFILRNTKNYFLPPLEKLEVYNLGMDDVYPIAQYWFHFRQKNITAISKEGQGKLLYLYPMFFLFTNLFFLGNLLWLVINKKIRHTNIFLNRSFILTSSFLLINFCFSIVATINVLRYQFFPMIILFSFDLLLFEFVDHKESQTKILPEYAG